MKNALDTFLDLTVLPGYTNAGYRIRKRMWSDAELPRMDGKVVIVTGSTSGLGLAAAEGFAALGASVRLPVRSIERGERARAQIIATTGNQDVSLALCDLSDLASVRAFVQEFRASEDRLEVLVNNAGFLPQDRVLSADGLEMAFATNVLGPFLLTNLLVPLLQESAPSRVISVSSGGMYTERIRVDDLQTERLEFDGPAVYARTKRAQVILTELWASRLAGTGVVVHSMHPGWANTPGVQESLPRFHTVMAPLLRSPVEGADTIVWLGAAEEPALSSGAFWHDRRVRPTHRLPRTKETAADREALWAACEELCGTTWAQATST